MWVAMQGTKPKIETESSKLGQKEIERRRKVKEESR